MTLPIVELRRRSRVLSGWLRHKPESAGLELTPDGYAAVDEIVAAMERAGMPTTREDLIEIVVADPKARYERDGDRIRARYGHTVALDGPMHAGMPPAELFHGCAERYAARVLTTGLTALKRQYVHLATTARDAAAAARRRDQQPAVVRIDAHAAHEAGVRFYPRGRGIWLSDPVPAAFIAPVLSLAPQPTAPGTPGTPRRRRPRGGFNKPPRQAPPGA